MNLPSYANIPMNVPSHELLTQEQVMMGMRLQRPMSPGAQEVFREKREAMEAALSDIQAKNAGNPLMEAKLGAARHFYNRTLAYVAFCDAHAQVQAGQLIARGQPTTAEQLSGKLKSVMEANINAAAQMGGPDIKEAASYVASNSGKGWLGSIYDKHKGGIQWDGMMGGGLGAIAGMLLASLTGMGGLVGMGIAALGFFAGGALGKQVKNAASDKGIAFGIPDHSTPAIVPMTGGSPHLATTPASVRPVAEVKPVAVNPPPGILDEDKPAKPAVRPVPAVKKPRGMPDTGEGRVFQVPHQQALVEYVSATDSSRYNHTNRPLMNGKRFPQNERPAKFESCNLTLATGGCKMHGELINVSESIAGGSKHYVLLSVSEVTLPDGTRRYLPQPVMMQIGDKPKKPKEGDIFTFGDDGNNKRRFINEVNSAIASNRVARGESFPELPANMLGNLGVGGGFNVDSENPLLRPVTPANGGLDSPLPESQSL